MWRLWLILGSAVWLATIGASAAMNYLAGAQLGRTPAEVQVFGLLGVAADIWKALGPLFIVALWRGRRRIASLLAAAVWVVCFAVASSAALGLAAQVRGATVGSRQGAINDYVAMERELADVERKRASRSNVRSSQEIESAIEQVLSRPIPGRGTVRSISEGCSKDYARTREACAEVAALGTDRAVALERQRLDKRAQVLREELARLRERGALGSSADPQAMLIERLTFGRLPAADVGLAVTLMIVVMIELVSAFAPLVMQEYVALNAARDAAVERKLPAAARRRRRRRAKRAEIGARGEVYDYLARRIRPDELGRVPGDALFDDYVDWCRKVGRAAIERDAFHAAVNQIARADLDGKIARHGDFYHGLALGPSTTPGA